MNKKTDEIQLLVISEYGSKELINKKNVSIHTIQETMRSLDWNEFHQVSLSKNDYDWIEVGGNLKEDGLACLYQENNELFVIDKAPTSVNQMTEILISYFKGDRKFKIKNKFTSESGSLKKKEKEYKKWKQRFLIQQKKEKIVNTKKIFISILVLVSIFLTVYYWYIGELQFIGQKTEFAKAKVVNTQMYPVPYGHYKQTVTYEFKYNNQIYSGTFNAGKSVGIQKIGNYLKIKFSRSNPNRSRMIEIYENN